MINCTFENNTQGFLRHAVVDAIVIHNGKILLIKRVSGIVEGGKWALPGGFINRNENAEETTLRELKEETGYEGKIKNLFCIITYPNRCTTEDRQNILFCYEVEVTHLSGKPDSEVTELGWFDYSEIDLKKLAFDHGKILKKYYQTLNDQTRLPIIINKDSDY